MEIEPVKPHEIPVRLLEQKKMWDTRLFCEAAITSDNWTAYVFSDDGEGADPWGAMIFVDEPMADALCCQTVIIDKKRRTPERLSAMLVYGHQLLRAAARSLGRKYAVVTMRDADKYLEILGNPEGAEVIETVIREEV